MGSLKVTYFDVFERASSDYVLQYDNCGLICESSEDIMRERSENRHFDDPTLI